MKLKCLVISIVQAIVVTLPPSGGAIAQSKFPTKPLKIVVSGAPGSVADMLIRPLADEMGKSLGVPVIVDNKPGAGGLSLSTNCCHVLRMGTQSCSLVRRSLFGISISFLS